MDGGFRILLIALLVIVLGVVFLWFQPSIGERLAPEPVGAWVAIEIEGRGVAEIGPVEIAAGTPFVLHAVLEAAGRDGPIYYTRAPALHFAGESEPVPASAIRPWDRVPRVKVRWFTVEGSRPYLELADPSEIEAFRLQTFFRSGWPDAWSIPGTLDPAFDDHLELDPATAPERGFGTQRYHVRIELYPDDESVLPMSRFASWGPEALPREIERFPTVVATLPDALAPASEVFGLTQLDPPSEASAEMNARLRELADQGLAFSRLTVLRDILRLADARLDDPRWHGVDLGARNRWGDAVRPGDLLRVGERVVVLFADRGEPDLLDYPDLCFDFVRGAAIRPLGEIFSGEGLVVEHLPIVKQ